MPDGSFHTSLKGIRPGRGFPETPHELPVDRTRVDTLLDRIRQGAQVSLIDEFLNCVDWRAAFASDDGKQLDTEDVIRLIAYYREKFADIGPVYLAELLSTEFMTELRAQGDVTFSPKLLDLGRNEPELWQEIRLFFRRKEFATAMLVLANTAEPEGSTGGQQESLEP